MEATRFNERVMQQQAQGEARLVGVRGDWGWAGTDWRLSGRLRGPGSCGRGSGMAWQGRVEGGA